MTCENDIHPPNKGAPVYMCVWAQTRKYKQIYYYTTTTINAAAAAAAKTTTTTTTITAPVADITPLRSKYLTTKITPKIRHSYNFYDNVNRTKNNYDIVMYVANFQQTRKTKTKNRNNNVNLHARSSNKLRFSLLKKIK